MMKLRVNGIKTLISQGVHKVLDKKGIKAIKSFYKMALLLNVMIKKESLLGTTIPDNIQKQKRTLQFVPDYYLRISTFSH